MLLAILFFSSNTSGDWRACVSLSRDVSAFHEYFLNFKLFVAAGVGSNLRGLHARLVWIMQWLVWNSFFGRDLKFKIFGNNCLSTIDMSMTDEPFLLKKVG